MCSFQDMCAVDSHESSPEVDGDCAQREAAERGRC